jgi:hypothetical protein
LHSLPIRRENPEVVRMCGLTLFAFCLTLFAPFASFDGFNPRQCLLLDGNKWAVVPHSDETIHGQVFVHGWPVKAVS